MGEAAGGDACGRGGIVMGWLSKEESGSDRERLVRRCYAELMGSLLQSQWNSGIQVLE